METGDSIHVSTGIIVTMRYPLKIGNSCRALDFILSTA